MIIQIKCKIECKCGKEEVFFLDYPQGPIPEFIYLDIADYIKNDLEWEFCIDDSLYCPQCKFLHLSNNNPE